jgi:hypothetical protein
LPGQDTVCRARPAFRRQHCTTVGTRADSGVVVRNDEARHRQVARGAVLALRQALAIRRQHPGNEPLWRMAQRHCRQALQAATNDRPLPIELHDDQVHAAGEALFAFAPGDLPFGPLRNAGVGALEFDPGVPAASIDELLERLQMVTDDDDAERGVACLFAGPPLTGVHVRAASGIGSTVKTLRDWALVLPASPPLPELRALVARDQAQNLPALAARQLLDDLTTDNSLTAQALHGLFGRMLADDDLGSATWLLGEVSRHDAVPPPLRARLFADGAVHCDDVWLAARIERTSRDELLALTAFVFQLGDDVADRFVQLTAAANQPLSRLLADMLGPRP